MITSNAFAVAYIRCKKAIRSILQYSNDYPPILYPATAVVLIRVCKRAPHARTDEHMLTTWLRDDAGTVGTWWDAENAPEYPMGSATAV